MKITSLLRPYLSLLAGAALALSMPTASAALPTGNLIVNGSGQDAPNVGWTIISSTGSGWGRYTTGGADDIPGYFSTSYVGGQGPGYAPGRRSQLIDLLATGATEEELDTSPPIRFSESISTWGTNNGYVDWFYLHVELRDANGIVLASWNQGSPTSLVETPPTWTRYEHTFSNYPAGVRFVYVEDGGYDAGYWGGHYGSFHDAATVEIIPDTDQDGLSDEWEIANGTDPYDDGTWGESSPGAKDGPHGAAGDLDGDGLTNAQELALGTRADLQDTDGDGFWDSWEDKSGVWVSATATGTDPLNPDTDRDGIPDGEENFSSGGTNPNHPDTDGDGFLDGVEVVHQSDPLGVSSLPVFPAYGTVLKEDFDGDSLNSTYAFTTSNGGYTAGIVNTGTSSNANVAGLTLSGNGNSNTSIAWDAVSAGANSIRLSFDFSITAGADGLGIGFFKTASYGETGAVNPGYNTTSNTGRNWENPQIDGAFPDAVVLGFRIYNANVLHFVSPDNPKVDRFTTSPGFSLSSGVFHRAIVTGYRAGPGTTVFNVDLVQDVNGAATTARVATNIVAKDFDIGTDTWRLIAGGRTGGVTSTIRIDHIEISSTSAPVGGDLRIIATSYDPTSNPPMLSISWNSTPDAQYTLEQSLTLETGSWTPLETNIPSAGTITTYLLALPNGSPAKAFFRVKED